RWIVVDNMDSSIDYNGSGWFTTNEAKENIGNFGPTYLSTLHGTNSSAELLFTFNGSAIRLWGTNNPREQSGIIDPDWDCLIDGASIGRIAHFAYAANFCVFCDWKGEVAGEHTLTVRASSKGQTFWVDMIDYVPPPEASVAIGQVVAVHHMDKVIRYGTGWNVLGDFARFTTEHGTTAEFEFEGRNQTTLVGLHPHYAPKASTTATYTLDGGPPVTFALRGPGKDEDTIFNQRFFETPPLSPGSHRILVVYGGNQETTPLTLTHLSIEGANSVSLSALYIPSQTSNSSSRPNSDQTEAVASTTRPVGAIIGGTVGGFAIIVAFTLAIFLLLRRR
ncbi:hypothetical protein BKA70DRAFT_1079473, partial [Coprinopsis sp. MPI-PUGE-AT-0042]